MMWFHSEKYIKYLQKVAPNLIQNNSVAQNEFRMSRVTNSAENFNVGENDCPCFEGLYEFCQISCGGSIDAAIKLNHKSSDICINWAGGLHHAKK
jgi:acetoin utilization deacetylase AcuC-like enzyme